MHENETLTRLDAALRSNAVTNILDDAISNVRETLKQHPADLFGWKVIPLQVFTDPLPYDVGSCWIFLIRPGIPAEKHRHPNSRQRTFSYSGSGDLQVWQNGAWCSNLLVDLRRLKPPEISCVSIPAGAWHRPVVKQEWVVVSFHTASATDLIEESGEDELNSRLYSR